MLVVAPGSSANLGPGFDALGLALDLPFRLATGDDADAPDLLACEPTHPAAVAYREAGGRSERLGWRSPIPPGRGLGFSGAARVAGALAGRLESGVGERIARTEALALACELERHPDNAAASMLGGFVVSAGGRSVRVPIAFDVEVVVWWPPTETSTAASRAALPAEVPFADAVFNVGRASLLVAALVTGDVAALRIATEDRLHTTARLERSPDSASALAALREAAPLACWLSGSGPAVAALVAAGDGERVRAELPVDGTSCVLAVDGLGARVVA